MQRTIQPASKDLSRLQEAIQQVVEAVAAALGVDVTVADFRLVRVAGTGPFAHSLGERVPGGSAFERALTSGETLVVADPGQDPICLACTRRYDCKETFETCTPIRLGDTSIGIIAIAAFTPEQRRRLQDRSLSYVCFLEKMSDLISSKAAEEELWRDLEARTEELEAVVNNIEQGVVCVDRRCCIKYLNHRARALLGLGSGRDYSGVPLESVWGGASLSRALKEGKDFLHCEEVYRSPRGRPIGFLSSVKVLRSAGQAIGAVCTFSELESTHQYAFRAIERGTSFSFDDIIGTSVSLLEVKEKARQVARYDSTILVTGETGTGKELFARAIHNDSPRRDYPFVGLNCAAIPESLLESELFGYEPGAFTGASKNGKPGKFELANHGTLFLDEIGDMPLFLQAKLLRVIQEMELTRVGGLVPRRVDIRLIAASNQDLEMLVGLNRFRSDLYYRVNVVPIHLPPLRERPEDIPALVDFFVSRYAALCNQRITGVTEGALRLLASYPWSGNVRELENVIEYAVNFAKGDRITAEDIGKRLGPVPVSGASPGPGARPAASAAPAPPSGDAQRPIDLKSALREHARRLVTEGLARAGHDEHGKNVVARQLGISRATLYRILSQR